MFKYTVVLALAGIFALGVPSKTTSTDGSWQVDARHSDAQLITDGTTDYGNTKINVALGVARVNGKMILNDSDPSKSSIEFRIYPATSAAPVIDEDGKFLNHWMANLSNHTLVCFHSKAVTRKPDGRLEATGSLVLTRIDRNVEATPNEAYAGPVYGPPEMHRVMREATFVFDPPATEANDRKNGSKDGEIVTSGSASMFREDFPQLVRAVLGTYWPPVVQDQNCQAAAGAGEAYHGSRCTGTFLQTPALPEEPHASNAEDIGAQQNFNAIVGNHLTILVHLRLAPKSSGETTAMGGN
jgi:polyisoprenoid-binding protein YceI